MALTKRTRIIAIVAVTSVLIVTGLGTAAVLAFPAERVGRLATERASAALERDVGVERVRLKLWPVPSVALENVTIARWRYSEAQADTAGGAAGSEPLAEVRRVELRPKLLPLLRREAVVRAIVVQEPTLRIHLDGAADPLPNEEPEGESLWSNSTFQIDRLEVRGGVVEYTDATTGATARAEGIDQDLRLNGEMRDGQLATLGLTGSISVESLDAEVPERLAVPFRDVRLSIEHDALVDMASQTASLQALAVTLGEMEIEGAGTIERWSDPAARRLALTFSTGDTEFAPILALLPSNLRSWPANAAAGEQWSATAGRGQLEAVINGRIGEGELPALDGSLTLRGVSLARGREAVVTDLGGRIDFTNESASTTGLTAQLLGAPLRLSASVRDFAAPVLDGQLTARVDLARATELGLLPSEWSARGAPTIDLAAAGPALEPALIRLDGEIALGGLSVVTPEWPGPLAISGGVLDFDGSDVIGRSLAGTLGESDFDIELAAADWLPFALGEEQPEPRIAFESRSRFVDMDALFPTDPAEPTYGQLFFARLANREVGGRSATEAAEAAGLALPDLPPLSLDGRITAERVRQRGAEFRDVDLELGATGGQLELRSADLQMLQGGVRLAARLDPPGDGSESAPFSLSFQIEDVEAEPFLQRFTAFRDHIRGAMRLDGSMTMRLDRNLLPDPATLSGGGNVSIAGGELVNWSVVRALGDRLGVARFDTLKVQDWTGRFDMVGSRILLSETSINSGDMTASVGGSFDVSGQLDLAGTIHVDPALASRLAGQTGGRLASAAAGTNGRVPVGVRISGSSRDAAVALDLTEAGRQLAERVRQEAEAEAREQVREAAGQLVGAVRLPAVETPAAAVDSARQRVGEAVVGRLRGLFGGGREATPDTVTAAPDSTSTAPADSTGG